MKLMMKTVLTAGLMVALLSGCNTAPKSDSGKSDLESRADAAVARFKTSDPTLSGFFGKAVGYAVFPNVGKGGFGVGGAYGKGVYYEGGKAVGYCDLSQGSIGFQLGGQVYSELVFFETAGTAKDFKEGHVEFSAQASAVAANKGAGANADYDHGVAVFTLGEKGLMYEASIGGQKFSYQAK